MEKKSRASQSRTPSTSHLLNKGVLVVAAVSGVIGFLLLVASSVLLGDIIPSVQQCHEYHRPNRVCHPVIVDVTAVGLGVLLGVFQIVVSASAFCRKATCSPHTVLAAQCAAFILALIIFSLTVYYDGDLQIEELKQASSAGASNFLFFYAASGIDWIFCLTATILANRILK